MTVDAPAALEEQHRVYHLVTQYYRAEIPVWVDTIEDPAGWAKTWQEVDGAEEVIKAVAAWIVVFAMPADEADLVSEVLLPILWFCCCRWGQKP